MYKYEMIAEEIQKKIKDGTYPPDTRLPQEMEMCKIYDASRITIREAMELLVAKGLITKRRGAGTFVKAVAPGMTDQVGFSKPVSSVDLVKTRQDGRYLRMSMNLD